MQLKWIEDLLAIEQTRSFSRASELRFVTQSALSRRVKSLEDWVGVELVDRGTYPVELTPAGRRFCEQSKESVGALTELRSELRQEARMPGRSIQITAGHTLSLTFLPKWLKQFHQQTGDFNARVVAANVHDAVVALAEGSCDLMIGYHHPLVPILLDRDKFVSLTLGHEDFIPVSAPDDRGKPLFSLPGSPDAPLPYLAYTATTFMGRVVEMILNSSDTPYHLRSCYETDMAMLLMKMVVERYGIAWLPVSAVSGEIEAGRLVRAGGEEWSVPLEIRSYRAISNTNPTMQDLWASLDTTVSVAFPDDEHDHVSKQGG
ncbi:DNA-binding transcriptional regulator, LysR family [Cupriavidus sp. YR651]|uniref:LysR substrate-binding domain-containing protein n=1 Tax=Cupriavidus sp. YR651 TaxID=1855315 RepID=UPI00088537D1|nr:LysR substrate-binding domain-containing protein [Cupriavidus sp. YR651]SDD02243.1 DNA-binding transcriptional regulator, LysR family [Cupriavidus sp. YR651]